jgi:hypothetical protein
MKIPLVLIPFFSLFNDTSGVASVPYFGNDAEEYASWLASNNTFYARHTFLSAPLNPQDGMAIHWTIQGEEIQLAVAARATGWLGFGTRP